eukprot:TRINITY_DN8508_c0_g1_i1.p1 TRINITY_DN8508_c0_g1~~TRINITY_DN8508_c0_g1_i1.p1  ORF type:complete len:498 (-),score=93.33 TRINITY_DN8508_c0_g1_i1:4-1497(-)
MENNIFLQFVDIVQQIDEQCVKFGTLFQELEGGQENMCEVASREEVDNDLEKKQSQITEFSTGVVTLTQNLLVLFRKGVKEDRFGAGLNRMLSSAKKICENVQTLVDHAQAALSNPYDYLTCRSLGVALKELERSIQDFTAILDSEISRLPQSVEVKHCRMSVHDKKKKKLEKISSSAHLTSITTFKRVDPNKDGQPRELQGFSNADRSFLSTSQTTATTDATSLSEEEQIMISNLDILTDFVILAESKLSKMLSMIQAADHKSFLPLAKQLGEAFRPIQEAFKNTPKYKSLGNDLSNELRNFFTTSAVMFCMTSTPDASHIDEVREINNKVCTLLDKLVFELNEQKMSQSQFTLPPSLQQRSTLFRSNISQVMTTLNIAAQEKADLSVKLVAGLCEKFPWFNSIWEEQNLEMKKEFANYLREAISNEKAEQVFRRRPTESGNAGKPKLTEGSVEFLSQKKELPTLKTWNRTADLKTTTGSDKNDIRKGTFGSRTLR